MDRLCAASLAAIAGLCAAPVLAQMPLPQAATPEEVGLSSAGLARIEAVTREHIDAGILPGAVMLAARNGRIAWTRAVGHRDRAAGDPMRPDAIFRLYSMTKPVVGVATMMLVEEGRLRLEDPVSRYIPEVRGMKVGIEKDDGKGNLSLELVDPEREMTVLDLMRHTSGLIYAGRGKSLVNAAHQAVRPLDRSRTNREFASVVAKLPLRFSPGTRFEYGISTDLLGRVVEVASGSTLGDFLHQRIFKPLDMVDTAFVVPPGKLGRAAQPWHRPGGPPMTPRFDVAEKPALESGGGGLVGTLQDYMRFATMLVNGGELDGKRLITGASLQEMTRDHLGGIPSGRPSGLSYGLCVEVRTAPGEDGKAPPGEYGWSGNAGTLFFVSPARNLIGIYLIQVNDDVRVRLRNEFRTLLYAATVD